MADLSTPKAAVLGWPINHSLSPRLHAYWLHQYGIKGQYEALPVPAEELADTLRSLAAQNYRGFNLTIPHKESALKIIDTRDAAAERIGAINLIIVDGGKLHGYNTDSFGFTENLRTCGFRPMGGSAFVLGAGGATRAVIVALMDMGFSEIRIANRTSARADQLAERFSKPACKIKAIAWDEAPSSLNGVELLVNATSLGMAGQPPLEFSLDLLPLSATVTDIVYAPLETHLLKMAKHRKHRTIDGLGMLLHQARPAFKAFFGKDPEVTQELRNFVLSDEKLP